MSNGFRCPNAIKHSIWEYFGLCHLEDCFSPKGKKSKEDIRYFYSAKCLKMALLGPPKLHCFRVKTTIWQMVPVSCIYPPPSRGRPPPHRKISGPPKVFCLCSFLLPEEPQFWRRGGHACLPRGSHLKEVRFFSGKTDTPRWVLTLGTPLRLEKRPASYRDSKPRIPNFLKQKLKKINPPGPDPKFLKKCSKNN